MSDTTELTELRAEVAALRADFDRLRDFRSSESSQSPGRVESAQRRTVVSRRGWMKAAAAAAVGGTAAALATSSPAAAAGELQLGNTTQTAAQLTVATYTGSSATRTAFQFRTGAVSINSIRPAALGGVTDSPTHPSGVYGYTGVDNRSGAGVDGVTDRARAAGVRATNTSSSGTALKADGGAHGVTASGRTAVRADGADLGVAAYGASAGVQAFSDIVGLVASGRRAALLLNPIAISRPRERNDAPLPGSIDAHSADGGIELWAAYGDTVKTWRKLSGPTTAGALHPITPGRAYDSREPQPGPVRLTGGTSAVVSVANGRSLDGGITIRPDMVPEGASAITYNITVTDTTGGGFLAVTPGDAVDFQAATVNWSSPGTTVGNAGLVKLDDSRQIKVFAGGGSANFTVDITGFYL